MLLSQDWYTPHRYEWSKFCPSTTYSPWITHESTWDWSRGLLTVTVFWTQVSWVQDGATVRWITFSIPTWPGTSSVDSSEGWDPGKSVVFKVQHWMSAMHHPVCWVLGACSAGLKGLGLIVTLVTVLTPPPPPQTLDLCLYRVRAIASNVQFVAGDKVLESDTITHTVRYWNSSSNPLLGTM
jgi:hypothetical protein